MLKSERKIITDREVRKANNEWEGEKYKEREARNLGIIEEGRH